VHHKILSIVLLFATISLILLLNINITGDVVDFSRNCYETYKDDIHWIISLQDSGHLTEEQAEERFLAIQEKCEGTSAPSKFYGNTPDKETCKQFRYDFKEQVGIELSDFFKQPGVCEEYEPELERCARSDTAYCKNMRHMLCLSEFKANCLK
jgi:hypothetical protein